MGRAWHEMSNPKQHEQGICVMGRVGEGNGNPLQSSCLENPTDGGAW